MNWILAQSFRGTAGAAPDPVVSRATDLKDLGPRRKFGPPEGWNGPAGSGYCRFVRRLTFNLTFG